MQKNTAFRIAATTMAVGLATVGCAPAANRTATLSASASKPEKDAHKAYERIGGALQQGNLAEALGHAETSVELSPRDVGYRMVLGDLYLKSGRFLSAEQAFSDILILNPGNPRASMSVALAQIAQGKTLQAVHMLDRLEGAAAVADLGLAYALAGELGRAIAMLEPAARAPEADGRTRQNLALAYALSGDWQKARVVASQDVSPAELGARLQQWAALAQPQAAHSQVASVLGIENVVQDSGQPAQLALAPEAPVMVEAPAAIEAPVADAHQVLAEAVQIEPPAADGTAADAKFAKAVETLVKPEPTVARAAAPAVQAPLPAFKPAVQRISLEAAQPRKTGGRFVVQIGAFRSQLQVEKAWTQSQKRYDIEGREPLSTTVAIPGKGTFHSLSVSGFDSHEEARDLCRSIKGRGGACFVRTNAGDSPIQWASRRSTPAG